MQWPRIGICPAIPPGSRQEGAPILRGLQELIEGDAVMGAWWRRYPLEEFSGNVVFKLLAQDIQNRVARPNLTYRFFRIDTPYSDHVTMVTLEGEDREGYVFSIGSSCREARAASLEKSLLEAIHGRHYARYLKSQIATGAMKVGRSPQTFAEHAVGYSLQPELLDSTILRSPRPVAGNKTEDLDTIHRLIERLGTERPVLFRSMTPPALATEQMDWQVVRVVIPGLQPMHGHHEFPHLGGPHWSPRGLADWSAMPPLRNRGIYDWCRFLSTNGARSHELA